MTRILLYVQDTALLKAFYRRYFDLPVIEEIDGEWVVLDADIDAHRARFARDGVTVRDLKRYDGFPYRMYDGIDPEGNVFQVMQQD